jgi:hypothetical protein
VVPARSSSRRTDDSAVRTAGYRHITGILATGSLKRRQSGTEEAAAAPRSFSYRTLSPALPPVRVGRETPGHRIAHMYHDRHKCDVCGCYLSHAAQLRQLCLHPEHVET